MGSRTRHLYGSFGNVIKLAKPVKRQIISLAINDGGSFRDFPTPCVNRRSGGAATLTLNNPET
jgi:hypothetical protein